MILHQEQYRKEEMDRKKKKKKKKVTKGVTSLAPLEGNMLFPSDCFHSVFILERLDKPWTRL